jgi:hypothetical protein
MTTYTSAMLTAEALATLFADGGTGQSPDAEDVAFVSSRIDALLEELSARNIVTVSDADDINPGIFMPLAELLADYCAPKFGQQRNAATRLDAEDRIQIVNTRSNVDQFKLKVDPAIRGGRIGYTVARWRAGT